MNKKYINSWINIAIKDLDASKILFKNKLYSNSFYHFQQASEKGLKAYLFMNKTFSKESDAYYSGHYMLKIFKNSGKNRQKNITKVQEYGLEKLFDEEILDDYTKNLGNSLSCMPNKNDTFEYSGKILSEILQILKELENCQIKFTNEYRAIFKEKMNLFFDLMYKLNPSQIEESRKGFEEIILNEDEFNKFLKTIESYANNIFIEQYYVLILYYSNLISHNHNNLARYPDVDFNPLKYYNLRKPLIKKLPEFSNYLKLALSQLKKWNNIQNPASE